MKKTFLLILLTTMLFGCKKDWLDYSPIDMYSANIDYKDSDAPKHLNVAAVSIQPSKTDKQETRNTIKSMVEKIKSEHNDIQVIVFGELILEWYYDSESIDVYQKQMAETIPGTSTDFIKNVAIANNVNIVFGLTEIDTITQNIYNTQVLIRNNGDIVKYRKRNLNQTDLDNKMTAGNELVITEIEGIRAAMFICSDMQSDKITKEIADAKVDVILHSLTSSTDLNTNISYVGTQMNTWIVFANRFGTEGDYSYTGFTHIINPAGTISERAVGNGVYVYRRLGIFNK
ncbi:MAG TPA: carbon-nitrogen hydrolase family protein [Bacilli bacterium]|nr:carbon-nitrogen hydrolase family protein [Bacteroidales bacterium]HOD61928.1 carbon-nitrogen hydrolase family protein [Bacilli bacterium]